MRSILSLLIFIAVAAQADEGFIGYGLGVAESAIHSKAETKVFSLGIRDEIWNGIYWQYKVGYWGDGSGDKTRKSSFYMSTGPGLKVDLRPVEIRSGWAIGTISAPDGYLGGHFPQFNGEFYVGLRDRRGNGIGIQYEHISSAGIVRPNQGRDFFVLQLSQEW